MDFVKLSDTDRIEVLTAFDQFFQAQLDALAQLAEIALKESNKKRINGLYPLLDSLLTSGTSIRFLIRHGLMTEAYIIARAYIERLVNVCYLIVCEQAQFEDYTHFSMQKVHRSVHSKRKAYENIGQIIPVPDFSNIPIVAEGLNKYTSQKGKEITRWTTLRIEKRIEAIGEKVKDFNVPIFLTACNYVYEDASEAIHGTLYGALFHTGMFYGAMNQNKGEEYLNSLRIVLYLLMGVLVPGLFLTAQAEVDTKDFVMLSDKNFAELEPYFGKRNRKADT